LALGFTLTYLSLIVLIPLAALILKAASLGFAGFWQIVTEPRTLAALRVSFVVSFAAALINVVFGLIVAWVLVRYRFPGRRLLDAIVDLPFALPTAVAGIALTGIYAQNGWIGSLLAPYGIKVAYTPIGIGVALVFIGLPFVVRTVQPVLEDFEREIEEAAASLGASRLTTFRRIVLPNLIPAIGAGAALSFARAISEYGSLVLMSGNLPFRTEVASVKILSLMENDNPGGAAVVAAVLLAVSVVTLLLIDLLGRTAARRA
jgi:sulfate transport system permease protein